MKKVIIIYLLAAILAPLANAEQQIERYIVEGKEAAKLDALRALLLNPESRVERCVLQKLSDKATLRNVTKNAPAKR